MKLNLHNILHSPAVVDILISYKALRAGVTELISGNYTSASNRFGMFASHITWSLAKIRFGFISILILVLAIGFYNDRVDRSGCMLVALGIFFAFGNHFSPKMSIVYKKPTNSPENNTSSNFNFDIDEHFENLAKPENQNKSLFFEFLFVFLGTLIWGFG